MAYIRSVARQARERPAVRRVAVAGLAILSLLFALVPQASAADSFSPVDDMAAQREGTLATLLPDGRVLISAGAFTSSAELFDPASGTFALTGSMTTTRVVGTTATLLPDGSVLITGGAVPSGSFQLAVASAEVYDPTTGTFSPTGSMSTRRAAQSATLLADGRVLIVGGHKFNFANSAQSSAEIYDPTTGSFSATGSMAVARERHTATLLAAGTVLITGGYTTSGFPVASAELYNPVTGTFSTVGSLAVTRGDHTATRLSDGTVLVVGGFSGQPGGGRASVEVFHPGTATFA